MTKEENFKLLKIQTCVLKVNIHCDGCRQKVKKLLQRTEGVYQVSIDAEQQKVTVSGSVDSATLIKKLVRAGKHAEVWSQKSNQNQNQNPKQNNCIKDDKNSINKSQKQGLIKGLEAFKNQQKFPVFIPQEEDDDYMDDYDEDDEEYELQFLKPSQMCQLGQMRLARQQALDANNARKGVGNITAGASTNNGKINNNAINGNSGKKENQNQNIGMKVNPGLLDQKTLAALKMNNAQLGGLNINATEGNRGSDINPMMMGVSGFHGNGANAAAALGGNPNSVGGFQIQSNNGLLQGSSASSFPHGGYVTTGQYPSSMLVNMNNGYNNHPSSSSMMSMMNIQNMHAMQQQQQPQMMYHRSLVIPPSTGYCYYNYSTPYSVPEAPNYNADHHSTTTTTHMFNDDNTSSSCSIM